jgi:hypothetical protein
MSLEVQVHEASTRLSIKVVGEYSLGNLYDLFDRVKEESANRATQGVILDLAGVAGTIPIIDMIVLGQHCSTIWKPAHRIAIVSPMEGLHKVFENVARNGGAQIAVVPNQYEAMEWLSLDQQLRLPTPRAYRSHDSPWPPG